MRWKPVPLYEELYLVSEKGDVRSIGAGPHRHTDTVLTWKLSRPYAQVDLARDGKKKRFAIHELVLLAFAGPKPLKAEGNHKNGNKRDNRRSNLEWVTKKQNAEHASRTGLLRPPCLKHERNGRAKLTEKEVAEVRRAKGVIGARRLASLYGVSRTAIQLIHQGKNWK